MRLETSSQPREEHSAPVQRSLMDRLLNVVGLCYSFLSGKDRVFIPGHCGAGIFAYVWKPPQIQQEIIMGRRILDAPETEIC